MLSAAALTYVAAALVALTQLLYLSSFAGKRPPREASCAGPERVPRACAADSSSRCSSTGARVRPPSAGGAEARGGHDEAGGRREEDDTEDTAGVVTIAAVGDIVMGSTPNMPPDGGRTFFDASRPTSRGMSCSATSRGRSRSAGLEVRRRQHQLLRVPDAAVLRGLAEEGRLYGDEPREQPRLRLRPLGPGADARGAREAAPRDHRPPGEIAYQQVGGIKVAIVGFAPYPWAQSLTNIPAAKRLVKKAAANADVVIVTMHAGAEGSGPHPCDPGTEMFLGENRGNSRAFTHAVVDAGADVVIGSGPTSCAGWSGTAAT